MPKGKKKYLTLREVKVKIDQMELRCERLPELYGYRPSDLLALNKSLITLCASLSLVFMQHDLLFDALALLKKATAADARLFSAGDLVDQLWIGRFHTFNSLAFLFQKYCFNRVQDYSSSLKFVRESLRLMLTCEKVGRSLKAEVALETNFTAFLVLWKVRKYREALTYIKLCTQSINDLNRHGVGSFSGKTRLNLVGIIAMSLSACIVKNEGEKTHGVEIMEQCLEQLSELDVAAKPLMFRFLDRLLVYKEPLNESFTSSFDPLTDGLKTPDYSLPSLPTEYFEKQAKQAAGQPVPKDNQPDLLVTKEFEAMFFITAFLSHIDPNTPLIREAELEAAQVRQHSTFLPKQMLKPKLSNKFFPQHEELPVVQNRSYLKMFKNIMSKSRAKMNYEIDRINQSVREQKDQTRPRADSNRPHVRADSEITENRTKSVPMRGRVAYLSPSYLQKRFSPSITVLQDVQRSKLSMMRARNHVDKMQQEAFSRRRTKQNIMVEFSPESQGESDVEISLQPLAYSVLPTPESALGRILHLPLSKVHRETSGVDSL